MGQGDKSGILSPALCRAARGLLDWTQTELAAHSDVSRSTIRDYEGERHDIHRSTAEQLRHALEDGGAQFVHVPDSGLCLCATAGRKSDEADPQNRQASSAPRFPHRENSTTPPDDDRKSGA
ncbi:transcriptional regulator with XRE-family HTH domain [Rhizobium taibaishanense]|uniref:Transcriptional regulator with XRE-family HTH domain n=1 Tax=Allorhizobium taibaishanense TaxID=887144 RepID=A0A7W6HMH6_9HYPH|nr:transcriptional regulator with XRE-family HTH domain [Allorhizobium taibaishanense]